MFLRIHFSHISPSLRKGAIVIHMSNADLMVLVSSNYSAFLMLGGLFILMYVYRDVHLPASRTFLLIGFVLLAMCVSTCLESWALLSADRSRVREAASVVHYVLQPLVIYLELAVLLPPYVSRPHRILLALPLAVNTLIYLTAPAAGQLVFWYDSGYSFRRGPLGASVYIVTFIYLALLIIWSVRIFHARDRRMSIVLLFMAGIAVLTAVLEWLNLVPGHTDEAFVIGVYMFYMYLINVYEHAMEETLMEKELELSKRDMTLLRQQIRPHFVFNALHMIKALIRTDREKALRSIENFSEYLRANIDIIRSDTLIPFENELSCTKAYVDLALADDSKDISVDYDINERFFRIPSLTVEPLVENAIRHGLKDGGKVTVSTRSEGSDIVIVVSDNGSGFSDRGTGHEQVRTGTGISNVRARLAALCGGTLEVKTGRGGTEAVIRIPKDRVSGDIA